MALSTLQDIEECFSATGGIGDRIFVDKLRTLLRNNINSIGVLIPPDPDKLNLLDSAATAGVGARRFIIDARTPVFGSAAIGGGAVKVPVYSDGTNWIVG